MLKQIDVDYLIIGGGPTGLGAASRLQEKGLDWHLLEAADIFGGLASSWVDPQGFTWDIGGHVQFSHYETFDQYMIKALGEEGWLEHQRESWVWLKNRWVPYPFQNNLHRLDPEDRWNCVQGLMDRTFNPVEEKPQNFEEWMLATFGEGVTDIFMRPYNFKVWAIPPKKMMYTWIGERVAVPPLDKVLRSICTGEDAVSWGPNSVFRFPVRGGTGAVWEAIGNMLDQSHVSLGTKAISVDPAGHTVTTQDGTVYHYKHLISTIALNHLIHALDSGIDHKRADDLIYSATNVVGVGLEGEVPDDLKTKCWMYFPEDNSPYYRVTVFSNYSPNNVPKPGQQWSLMTETAESDNKPVNLDSLVEDTVKALVEDGMIPDETKIVSKEHRRLAQGYPTPYLERDDVVDPILRELEALDIYSRGRFGAWKYEVANQDHSFAQGYECVERLAAGGGAELEPTLHTPDVVNSQRNP